MMNKKRSSRLWIAKYLLIIPLAIVLIQCGTKRQTPKYHAEPPKPTTETEEVVNYLDDVQYPTFPNGEAAMMTFISDNLKYPKKAQEAGIQGRVIIRLIIEEDGSIGDVEVLEGINPACDTEAIRVIKAMPKWTPGTKDGKPVSVYFTIPISFRLR